MAETQTQRGLAGLAANMPVRNKLIADQQKAARALQLQQAVAGMTPQQTATPAQAAQMGAAIAGEAGKQQVSQAGQMVESAGQMAKLGQQETALAGGEKLGGMQLAAQKESLGQAERLAALDDRAKREVFDAELQFKKDAADQTQFTQRQLLDYARVNAKSDDEFKTWSQRAQQASRRNIQVLETINSRLEETLRTGYVKGKQKLDQESRLELTRLKRANDEAIARARANGANTAMAGQAIGGVMTAVGTGLILSGVGTPVGVGLMVGGTALSSYSAQEGARQQGEV
jgi:predicted nucleic acid-binding protein